MTWYLLIWFCALDRDVCVTHVPPVTYEAEQRCNVAAAFHREQLHELDALGGSGVILVDCLRTPDDETVRAALADYDAAQAEHAGRASK